MTKMEATELMLRYLEGQAGEADVARLQSALRTSPELVASCAEVARQHLQLRELGEEAGVKTDGREFRVLPGGLRHSLPARPFWLYAAAAAVFALATLWFFKGGSPFHPGVRARVIASENAGVQWPKGARVSLRAVTLPAGSVQLRLQNGAVVTLTAPLDAEFVSPLRVKLARGQITTDVSAGGKGFVVEANGTDVIDLGTQFGVKVNEAGETDVVVFQGEVQLGKTNGGAKPWMNLNAGEAVTLDASRHATRIQAIYSESAPDTWSLQASTDAETLVKSVSDNIVLPDFQGFYSIVPGGMRHGANPYTGGRARWRSPSGVFPPELLGADIITTLQDKRFSPEFQMTIELSQPATVYLMHDLREPAPEWLRREFVETDMTLPLSPVDLPPDLAKERSKDKFGNVILRFRVWKKEVPAGNVSLGESLTSAERIPHFMYGLAVKRR